MELVIQPFPIVCWVPNAVIKYSLPCHFIVLELSLVIGIVLKDQFAMAVLLTI